MPREHKKRGRRAEAAAARKRKHDDTEDLDGHEDLERDADVLPPPNVDTGLLTANDFGGGSNATATASSNKRRKSAAAADTITTIPSAVGEHGDAAVDGTGFLSAAYPPVDRPFFGLLDQEEQESLRRADELLELNDFSAPEERSLFLDQLWREADGKELKVATSQSCSRLLERLIQLSTPAQLKNLFQKFSGNFVHLIAHRFASHCVEKLFVTAAPFVSDELSVPEDLDLPAAADGIYVSMEDVFLHAVSELQGNLGFAMTDRFASHVLRVLLLVLSGEPLSGGPSMDLLASKRKEGVSVQGLQEKCSRSTRTIPASFVAALEQIITDCVTGLDTDKLRALAMHPSANPVLQLLLKVELTHFGKQRAKDERSLFKTLIPDDPVTSDCGSAAFVNGLVYDTIGSHLVETMVERMPGKQWKSMYRAIFKERLAAFARNDIAAYVVRRVLERLGRADLFDAHEILVPHFAGLLERDRTVVACTLIERCAIRDIDTQAIAVQIDATFQGEDGFDIRRLVMLDGDHVADSDRHQAHDSVQSSAAAETVAFSRPSSPAKVHFNVLAQAMLRAPGSLSALVLDSLTAQEPSVLLRMASDPIVTHTIQAAISSKFATIIQTRKMVSLFYGHIGEMALDRAASHVVDCIWEGTHGLAFIRERIAEELAENEASLRQSPCGRGVWKNWKMDIYKRKRGEWIRQSKIKASNDGFQSFSELDRNKGVKTEKEKNKTPLQIARELHVKKIRAGEREGNSNSSTITTTTTTNNGDKTHSSSSRKPRSNGNGGGRATRSSASAPSTTTSNATPAARASTAAAPG